MDEKACRNCKLIISHGDVCPSCGSKDLTTKWSGYAIILNAGSHPSRNCSESR